MMNGHFEFKDNNVLSKYDQFVADLAFAAMMTTYIPILPINFETQPLIALMCIMLRFKYVIVSLFDFKKFWLSFLFWLLLVSALASCLINPLSEVIVSFLKYLLPILFFMAILKIRNKPSANIVRFFLLLNFIVFLISLTGHAEIVGQLFDRYTVGDGLRGFSYLAPEPSYAATYLFVLFVCTYLVEDKFKYLHCWICIILILSTKSLLGIIFVILCVVLMYGVQGLLVGLLLGLPALYFLMPGSRLDEVINALKEINKEDILLSLVLLEPSGMTRVVTNFLSIFLGASNGVGFGIGSFTDGFIREAVKHNLNILGSLETISAAYIYNGTAVPQSYFASLFFEIGFLSLAYIIVIYNILREFKYSDLFFVALALTLIFGFFQSQVSNPIFLYLLYILLKYKSKENGSLAHIPINS